MAYRISDKKKALLAYKEEILKDIKYFEKRIEEARFQKTNKSYYDDDDSDSDNIFSLDTGPSIPDLKLEQGRLQTCLHATQELTNVCVLQSEVNVMVKDPVFEREPPVTEEGTWREVTADCRVDLVPFSITFYTHKPSRQFGPISYRGLRVLAVKAAHENELAKSILPRVDKPSDAVEVLRSYAVAHRSRRTTLARLAEKYSNSLFMEPMIEGGYIIKCGKLLEVSWTLENKWSPVAAFHHRMKFDLDYMDEAYVKIISQAHRELSDPSLETDERTRLMSKIIATCIEVQGPSHELYESLESDIESENLRKRHTNLDEENEEPVNKKKKDSEIMAPPKSLPKKTKPKGKENNAECKKVSKSTKRSIVDDVTKAKKAKLSQNNLVKSSNVTTLNKNDKEVTSHKATDIRDIHTNRTNVNKEKKSESDKKENVVNTKNCNENNAAKSADVKNNYINKEDVVTLKKTSNSKGGNVENNGGSSDVDNDKNTDANKNVTDKVRNVKESTVNKKKLDKYNVKSKPVNEKKVTETDNSNKLANIKKLNKMADKILNNNKVHESHNIPNNKNAKLNKFPKNVERNFGGSKKVTSAKDQNFNSDSQKNNERSQKNKGSNSHTNIANKGEYLNTYAKVIDKTNDLKTNSSSNVKDNVARADDDLNIYENSNKKSVIKTKSKQKSKSANPLVSNSENLNPENPILITHDIKNVNNCEERNVKINSNRNVKSKSNEDLTANTANTKSKSNKKENMSKESSVPKNSNKQMPETDSTKHVTKEHPTTSALSNKNAKLNLNLGERANKRDSAITHFRQGKAQFKVTNNATEKNNDATFKKPVNKNVVSLNNQFGMDVNKRNTTEINEKIGSNLLTQKYSIKERILDVNDNKAKRKLLKSNLKTKNNAQNIANNKNLKPSEHLTQKTNSNVLNSRNKITVDKPKVIKNKQKGNDTEKDRNNKNKIFTKNPQKLMTVHEQILNKNPLRISPRKPNVNLKTDSQNSSRSSLRSLQKPMTGIPRLMKKPIRKE